MKKDLFSLGGLTENHAAFLLACVIIARATSLLFAKYCLETIPPFTLLALRCLLAILFLLPFFWRKLLSITRQEIVGGCLIGLFLFLTMGAELMSLQVTDSAMVAILENTAIIFVPILQALLTRRFPKINILLCCGITLVGIILLLYEGGAVSISRGEWLSFAAALCYTFAIVCTARVSRSGDAITIGIVQVACMGFLSLLVSLFAEGFVLPATGKVWFSVLYLAIVCTGFGYTLQPLAQSHCSTEKAGLFCALNPITSVLLGVLVLHEAFFLQDFLGLILILGAIFFYSKYENRAKHVS